MNDSFPTTATAVRTSTETVPLEEFGLDRAAEFLDAPEIELADPRLRHLVRVRLLTSPGDPYWLVSYVWGTGSGGTEKFRVKMPGTTIPRVNPNGTWVEWFTKARRGAKAMGLWAPGVQSKVW